MAINRRNFLALSAGILAFSCTQSLHAGNNTRLLSCRSNSENQHFITLLNLQGRKLFDIPLPTRGHGITVDPQQTVAAVFARRPGDYVWVIDLHSGQVIEKISAAENRHYYGHGVFTRDQQYLLCSENNFDSGKGCIGIYDRKQNYKRIGELDSYGIGPHEIKLLTNGSTLVIANGGISTHPDLPRVKSNLNTMRPNLAYVDIHSGRLLNKVEPPEEWYQLSIRHIDIAHDDTVAIAMQFQGKMTEHPPLIATHHYEEPSLNFLTAPTAIQNKMRNYCGSIVFSHDGSHFAVSSPRGNLVTYWNRSGTYLGLHKQDDVCGISANGSSIVASDGTGALNSFDDNKKLTALFTMSNTRWDNHLLSI